MKLWVVLLMGVGAVAVYMLATKRTVARPMAGSGSGGNQVLNQAAPYANTLANVTSIFDKLIPTAQTGPDSTDMMAGSD